MNLSQRKLILAAAIAAIMSGCTGGTDSNLTNNTTPTTPAAKPSVLAIGEIDGFGSVIVNGVHYATDKAKFFVDGEPATEDDLDVGMVVEVDGEDSDAGASAKEVHFYTKIAGPIEALDVAAQTLTIMGKTIIVDADTVLADTIDETTWAPLAVGSIVRISGTKNSEGNIIASRVDVRSATPKPAPVSHLSGLVTGLDTSANQFTVDGQLIDFSAANIVGGELADGVRVVVHGKTTDGVLAAEGNLVVIVKKQRPTVPVHVEIKGPIKRNSDGTFSLGDKKLHDIKDAIIKNGDSADLQEGEVVVVEGEETTDGEIKVKHIKIEMGSTVRVQGKIDSISTSDMTVTLDGKKVHIESDTDFTDKGINQERHFDIADLEKGDKLIVNGFKNTDGEMVIKAVKRVDHTTPVKPVAGRLHTTIASIDGNTLTTTDGVTVVVSALTHLAPSVDLAALTLGAEGTELFIAGPYTEDGSLAAKFITTLRVTPTKEHMPRPEASDNEKLNDIKEKMEAIKAKLEKEHAMTTADKEKEIQDIKDRIADVEDRVKDNADKIDQPKADAIIKDAKTIKESMAKNPNLPAHDRAAMVAKLEALIAKLTNAGDTQAAAKLEQLLANISAIDKMMDEKETMHGDDMTPEEIKAALDKKLDELKKRTEEQTNEPTTPMMDGNSRDNAIAKITAIIAKITADESLSEEEKTKILAELNTSLSRLTAPTKG